MPAEPRVQKWRYKAHELCTKGWASIRVGSCWAWMASRSPRGEALHVSKGWCRLDESMDLVRHKVSKLKELRKSPAQRRVMAWASRR